MILKIRLMNYLENNIFLKRVKFMKKIILMILILIVFSCTSQKPKETVILEKKEIKKVITIGCLSFIIPDNMHINIFAESLSFTGFC